MGIGPGSMYGLGQVQCEDWARFNARIGPGSILTLGLTCFILGPMYGLGQVQCMDWARFNVDIELAYFW